MSDAVQSFFGRDIPRWYFLSWLPEELGILLGIHEDFVEKTLKRGKIDLKNNVNNFFDRSLNLPEFYDDFNTNIGFAGILENRGKKDGFINFVAKLPKISMLTEKTCPRCKGTGKENNNEDCFNCCGTGKDSDVSWTKANIFSASFSLLFFVLDLFQDNTPSKNFQLMEINTIVEQGMGGGSLSGRIGAPMHRYLCGLAKKQDDIPEMTKAMKIAYKEMWRIREWDRFAFKSTLRPEGGFAAECIGNATGIHIDMQRYIKEMGGFEFTSHNVDTLLQQITLLVSLAALHDKAVSTIG